MASKHLTLKLHALLLVFSVSGIFSKLASKHPFLSSQYLINMFIVLVIFGLYAIFWQLILKEMTISSAYAHRSILVIWGFIWGWLIFDEVIDLRMILAAVLIMFGLWLIGEK